MAVANKHIEKAERLLQKSKIEAALEEYLLAWQEEPENDAIVYTVAELYQKLNRNVQSKECYVFLFDKAVERNDAQKVLELTRKMQVVGVLEPARLITAAKQLEKQRPDLASEQYRKAMEIAGEKNYEVTLQCLQGMARLTPGSLDIHKRLAAAAANSGNTSIAVAAYRKLADLYMPIGRAKEAIQALEQICLLTPKDESAQIALAKAYLKGNRFQNVLKMWKDIAEESRNPEVMDLLAQAYLAEKDPEKAEVYYWKLLEDSPQAAGSLLEIAKQYIDQNQDTALTNLMKRIEDRVTRAHPTKELIGLVEKLTQLEHTSLPILESLARLLDRLHLDSPLANVLNGLFDLYFASRQFPQAADVLERLINVDPYNPESTSKLERLEGKADASFLRELASRLGLPPAAAETSPASGYPSSGIVSPAAAVAQGPDSGVNPLKDLMLQAEIFLQYGMQDKARERIERIAKLFPGEETKNEELAALFEKAGIAVAHPVGTATPAAPVTAAEARDFRADLKRVSEISRNLSRQGTVKSILFTAVNEIGRYWQVSRCVVGLATLNRPPSMAMEYISQGIAASDAAKLGKLVMGLQQANAGKNFPLVAENVAESPPLAALQDTLAALQVESLVAVPLRDGDQEIGVLVMQQCIQRRSWKGNDLAGLEALAEQIVLAIANVRLRNLMKALAVTDETSGLLHRDSYITCLLSEAERMRTQKTPLSVVLMYFSRADGVAPATKKDDASKPAGKNIVGLDIFLQKYSASVMGQLRQNDMAVKYGASTLALILPGALGKDAANVMEKMRRLAASTAGASPEGPPHLAAGVAEAIREGAMDSTDRVTELINRVEWALEAARQAGSDTVKLLDPPALPA
ncbi:MAG: tetratricopeptide repeat protein [Acidobacteria bacterium]|nr:tetratricopeptide repeat protein [Acidobacteriota bacterium]